MTPSSVGEVQAISTPIYCWSAIWQHLWKPQMHVDWDQKFHYKDVASASLWHIMPRHVQIPHDYTVEVMDRFKGLDLVDRVPEELWIEVHSIVQEVVTKTIPKKKKCKKAKWLSKEALQTAEKRSKKQRRKGKIYPTECRVSESSKQR